MPKRSFDGRLCAFGQGRRHRCSVHDVPFCYALQCFTRLFNSRSPVTEIGVIFYHSCRSIERQSNFNISAWVSHASCFRMESGVPSRSSLAPALPFFLPPIVIQPPLSWSERWKLRWKSHHHKSRVDCWGKYCTAHSPLPTTEFKAKFMPRCTQPFQKA